jgi:hypothetical protein
MLHTLAAALLITLTCGIPLARADHDGQGCRDRDRCDRHDGRSARYRGDYRRGDDGCRGDHRSRGDYGYRDDRSRGDYGYQGDYRSRGDDGYRSGDGCRDGNSYRRYRGGDDGGARYGYRARYGYSRSYSYEPTYRRRPVYGGYGSPGFSLSVGISNLPPAGYSYYDPYCGESFASLDLCRAHFGGCHHPRVIQVVAVGGGDPVGSYCWNDGGWRPY